MTPARHADHRSLPFCTAALVLATCVGAFAGCSTAGSDGDNEQRLLRDFITSYVEQFLQPASETWQTESSMLAEQAADCTALDAATFAGPAGDAVRRQFETTFVAFKRLRIARFGPFDEQPYRLVVKVDGWPVDGERIDEAIAAQPTAESMRDLGANQRGLPALGFVLHERLGSAEQDAEDYADSCRFLQAASSDLAFLADEWNAGFFADDSGYAENILAPSGEAMLEDDIDVLTLLLQNTLDAVYLLREDNLQAPRGTAPDGEVDLSKVEQRAAGLSLASIDATLDAARQVLLSGDNMDVGVDALYGTRSQTATDDIKQVFATIDSARAALPGTLDDALVADVANVDDYIEALRGLSTIIRADIMGTLGLTVSFTDADGD